MGPRKFAHSGKLKRVKETKKVIELEFLVVHSGYVFSSDSVNSIPCLWTKIYMPRWSEYERGIGKHTHT